LSIEVDLLDFVEQCRGLAKQDIIRTTKGLYNLNGTKSIMPNSSRESLVNQRPNIILVMVDDMGYSDISPYGGEIETPNLGRLADDGLRFTQFSNYARCCPTRASLMTGLHPHQAGIGYMTNEAEDPESSNRGVPGYQGHLNDRCVTIAEVLSNAGYHTAMAGKWHLGQHKQRNRPTERGFDRYYGHLSGWTNYFNPTGNRGLSIDNGDPGSVEPESTTDRRYYTTDAFTDWGIRFAEDAITSDEQPFFLYLSYNAPHWPLHAHEDVVEKYRGEYADGWDEIRKRRYRRQVDLGLFDEDTSQLTESVAPDWESLSPEKREEMDHRMAIYAAQIDIVDQNLGKLVEFLEKQEELDNTLLLFLSDNGACAEGEGAPRYMLGGGEADELNDPSVDGWISYGEAWANVSNTPFRKYKRWTHEGGVATPFIAHWPAGLGDPGGEWRRQPAHLPDVMSTVVDVAEATYPERRNGNTIPTMEGVSLLPAFAGEQLDRERPICLEHEGNRAIRVDRWKLVSTGSKRDYGTEDSWELYDMAVDRSETTDLSAERPDKLEQLRIQWWKWAERTGVVPNGKGVESVDDIS
jgi:arylsulfatase